MAGGRLSERAAVGAVPPSGALGLRVTGKVAVDGNGLYRVTRNPLRSVRYKKVGELRVR